MELYARNESGEFHPATDAQIEDLFRERSDRIVARRVAVYRANELENELEKLKPEIEEKVRKETSEKLESEITERVKAEYDKELSEARNANKDLEVKLRRKTIAAEYGFKAELEDFLGDGSDDEMRAKADILKSNSANSTAEATFPEKKDVAPKNESEYVRLVDTN